MLIKSENFWNFKLGLQQLGCFYSNQSYIFVFSDVIAFERGVKSIHHSAWMIQVNNSAKLTIITTTAISTMNYPKSVSFASFEVKMNHLR